MNSLDRSLIQKAGYDNGWEVVAEESPDQVILASALHSTHATVTAAPPSTNARWLLTLPSGPISRELGRAGGRPDVGNGVFPAAHDGELGQLLRMAARLAQALPDEPCQRFTQAVAEELAACVPTSETEVERLVRQRVGQSIYRESLMDYWGGACAVTGIAIPELLRASHAKPWAECASDAERLNVFNGFLLCAHLDAIFDRHLPTFADDGQALFAPIVTPEVRISLGIFDSLHLRWVTPEQLPFLRNHRFVFDAIHRS